MSCQIKQRKLSYVHSVRHNCLVNISESLENVMSVVVVVVVVILVVSDIVSHHAMVCVYPPSRVHIPPVT